jgi:small subunit ribosomal protein S7
MAKRKKKDGRSRSMRKMSRRRMPPGRGVFPDNRYSSALVSKFINNLMWDGKKSVAEHIFYSAMDMLEGKVEDKEVLEVFLQAIENIRPALEVKSRRVGGANYQVPIEVKPNRQQALAIRWLILYARKRGERTMAKRLFGEILDAYNNTGGSIKKKDDTHKMAEANKAFAHYRW